MTHASGDDAHRLLYLDDLRVGQRFTTGAHAMDLAFSYSASSALANISSRLIPTTKASLRSTIRPRRVQQTSSQPRAYSRSLIGTQPGAGSLDGSVLKHGNTLARGR